MFRIDPKIRMPHVGDASGDVITLIEVKAIEPRRHRRSQHRTTNNCEEKQRERSDVDTPFALMFSFLRIDRQAHRLA
jgi:hypothetical protein